MLRATTGLRGLRALRFSGQRAVSTSTFDLFKIGVGPSSSHTVGPMAACNSFVAQLAEKDLIDRTEGLCVKLYGSLALTGKGHATDQACLLGLSGMRPDAVEDAPQVLRDVEVYKQIKVRVPHAEPRTPEGPPKVVPFDATTDLVWVFDRLPAHANGMIVQALDAKREVLFEETYYSIGGGFIRTAAEMQPDVRAEEAEQQRHHLHFKNMAELLALCASRKMSIAEVMRHNEQHKGMSDEEIDARLDRIWAVMDACIERGLHSEETHLPAMNVRRRAPGLLERDKRFARSSSISTMDQPYLPMLSSMSKLSMFAIAVNEENAGGWSQVVTAPTNGASGIVPACIRYLQEDLLHERFVRQLPHLYDSCEAARVEAPRLFLLTAAAVGALIKQNSSISGAEAGCMGEVGSASSMAAAGITACLGGSAEQVEMAAEMAMEHSLGLTCDPIEGLVQIPCIERNAMGATKAMNSAALALMAESDAQHNVDFDTVIQVMKRIGEDMKMEYKETALGGLAVFHKAKRSLPEC